MPNFSLSVPSHQQCDQIIGDFALAIELAQRRAAALDAVVNIGTQEAMPGHPNCWSVSPKGYVFVESIQLPTCRGCG